jgi:hypothetical protein
MGLGASGNENEQNGYCRRAELRTSQTSNHLGIIRKTRGPCQTRRCASAPRTSWKYHQGRGRTGKVGLSSGLTSRAEKRGFRATKASLRSADRRDACPAVLLPARWARAAKVDCCAAATTLGALNESN